MRPAVAIRSFGAEFVLELRQLLKPFLVEAQARCAAIVDRDGRLLALEGDARGFDRDGFATLAAADFDASDQLAELLGEPEFSSLYHHGPNGSMYLVDLGGYGILATIFDDRTTLGLVRMRVREAVPEMMEVLDEAAAAQAALPARGLALDAGWADEAGSEIDRLFAE